MLEVKLRPEDDVPGMLIVFEDEDGTWHHGLGWAIDPATVDRARR
jgi:hypothetical protein